MTIDTLKKFLKNKYNKIFYDIILEYIPEDILINVMLNCNEEELFKIYKYGTSDIHYFLIGKDLNNNVLYLGYVKIKNNNWKFNEVVIMKSTNMFNHIMTNSELISLEDILK